MWLIVHESPEEVAQEQKCFLKELCPFGSSDKGSNMLYHSTTITNLWNYHQFAESKIGKVPVTLAVNWYHRRFSR